MAVTQQLARLDGGLVARCMRDARLVDELCALRLVPRGDHLDLDWSPAPLERAGARAGIDADRLDALRLATDGGFELNPAHADSPDPVHEPVRLNPAPRVRVLAVALRSLVDEGFPPEHVARVALARPGGETPTDPHAYLVRHLAALADFYAGAAERGLAIATWWD